MAISLKTAGTWARIVADPSSVTIPGTPAAGDRMFLFVSWKTYTITVADISGWTSLGAYADGTTGSGNGSGSVKVQVWYRDWQSGDGNPSVNWSTAPTEGHGVIQLWQKGASDGWATPVLVNGAIAAADPFTVNANATVTVPDGSVVMCLVGLRDDSTTMTRATDALDDTGALVTWNGNYVESPATHFNSTTGQDMSGDLGHRFVTTGASGVTLHADGDISASESGAAAFVVQGLRVNPSGTGAITVPAATVSGTGTHTPNPTGTGAISVPAATVSGTGSHIENVTGTGAITAPAATVDGTGAESFVATGAISVPSPTVAGTGAESFTATGAVTAPAATVAGSGAETFTGTGAVSVPAATVSGDGNHEAPVASPEGAGAVTVPAATVAGTGSLGITGTGAVTAPAATVAGTGAESFAATGAIAVPAPTVAGTGSHLQAVTGTGAILAGAVGVAGTGSHAQAVTGTGAILAGTVVVAGTGTHRQNVTGTGAIVIPAPVVAGLGLVPSGGHGGRGGPIQLPDLPGPDADEAYLLLVL